MRPRNLVLSCAPTCACGSGSGPWTQWRDVVHDSYRNCAAMANRVRLIPVLLFSICLVCCCLLCACVRTSTRCTCFHYLPQSHPNPRCAVRGSSWLWTIAATLLLLLPPPPDGAAVPEHAGAASTSRDPAWRARSSQVAIHLPSAVCSGYVYMSSVTVPRCLTEPGDGERTWATWEDMHRLLLISSSACFEVPTAARTGNAGNAVIFALPLAISSFSIFPD